MLAYRNYGQIVSPESSYVYTEVSRKKGEMKVIQIPSKIFNVTIHTDFCQLEWDSWRVKMKIEFWIIYVKKDNPILTLKSTIRQIIMSEDLTYFILHLISKMLFLVNSSRICVTAMPYQLESKMNNGIPADYFHT